MSLTDELIKVSDALKEVVTDRNENYIKVSELRNWYEAELLHLGELYKKSEFLGFKVLEALRGQMDAHEKALTKFCGGKRAP